MRGNAVSRRDGFALLGAGAVAAITPAAPAESVNQSRPWLKAPAQTLPTSLRAISRLDSQSKKEAEISLSVQNTGKLPAYPARAELPPGHYSVLWSDNFLWLAPGETVTVRGTVRLDKAGLDPITNPCGEQAGSGHSSICMECARS
jgi:Exo-beta-D-glucosaminidase Ig-fold domain